MGIEFSNRRYIGLGNVPVGVGAIIVIPANARLVSESERAGIHN